MSRRLWQKLMVGMGLLVLLMLLTTVIPTAPAAAPEKPMTLVYESWMPAALVNYPVIVKYFEGLEQATGGAVKTKYYLAGAMGKGAETYSRLLAGVCNIAHFGSGFTPGVFPMYEMFELPIRFPSPEVLAKAMVEMYKKGYFDKEFADIKPIIFFCADSYVLFSRYKFTTLADLRGKKIRCGTEGYAEITKALGAVPVTLPSSEIYLALQKGIVDADWMARDGVNVWKHNEVTSYLIDMSLSTWPHIVAMNKDTWAALPQAGKDYINKTSPQCSVDIARASHAGNAKGVEKFLATPGREIVTMAPAEWDKIDKALAPIFDKWVADKEAKGLPAKKALGDFYKIMRDLGVERPFAGYRPK